MKKEEVVSLNPLKKEEITGIELEQLLIARKDNKASFLLVDVREEEEYNIEKIVGVDMLIPTSEFYLDTKIMGDYKKEAIILQCRSGARSHSMQQVLKGLGYDTVINLSGGILDYKGLTE